MSIRLKLRLLYLACIAVTITVFGIGLQLLLMAHVDTEVDETLRGRAREVVRIAQVSGGLTGVRPEVGMLIELPVDELREREVYLQVLDPQGRPVVASVNLRGQSLPVTDGAMDVIATHEESIETINVAGRFRLRLLSVPILRGDNLVGVLQSAQSMQLADSTTQRSRNLLIGGAAVVFVVASLSALYLTRTAVNPVAEITRTAEAIYRQGDLSRRINIGAGKDDLSALGRTFNRMLDHIEDSVESQRRFVGDASHELKTPLTVIRGNAELLGRDPSGLDATAAAAITREADRMQRIVNDLLAVAELDAPGELRFEPVNVRALIVRVLTDLGPVAAGRSLGLAGTDAAWVFADADKLERALRNLVQNAITATPDYGVIQVGLTVRDGTVSLTVSDNGPGIPTQHLPHVFDRFYRADPARSRAGGGTGLGLTIVRSVAETHGGSVQARRADLGGAEVEIRLPAGRPPAQSEPPIHAS
ncbi:MAG: HAMP domain-containing sensor histidine kinase [Chloroflexota bacterium]|nr:HAMP domain-containing sensor histidine kinase [Chloroflexota bacterium]